MESRHAGEQARNLLPLVSKLLTLLQQLDRQLPKMLVEELNVLQVSLNGIGRCLKPNSPWQIIPTERHRLKLVNTLRRQCFVAVIDFLLAFR